MNDALKMAKKWKKSVFSVKSKDKRGKKKRMKNEKKIIQNGWILF